MDLGALSEQCRTETSPAGPAHRRNLKHGNASGSVVAGDSGKRGDRSPRREPSVTRPVVSESWGAVWRPVHSPGLSAGRRRGQESPDLLPAPPPTGRWARAAVTGVDISEHGGREPPPCTPSPSTEGVDPFPKQWTKPKKTQGDFLYGNCHFYGLLAMPNSLYMPFTYK